MNFKTQFTAVFFLLLLFVKLNAAEQEYYELRIYKTESNEKRAQVMSFLEKAWLPAVERIGIDRVGVFTVTEKKVNNFADRSENGKASDDNHAVVVLIPFKSVEQFSTLRDKLNADKEYQTAAAKHFDRALNDPVFKRIESRFMKAFAGMPVIEQPEYSKKKEDRIFELRLYESHTENHAKLKVEMFNEGEIDLMRDLEMGPVFYGETLIGPTVPNLVYMLSARNAEDHGKHWQAFIKSPVWAKMSKMEKYKNTVSKIVNWYLVPAKFSQL